MEFGDLVRQARSYRRFKAQDPIPHDLMVQLVDLARLVPSGGNRQPLRYRVVADAAACAKLFPHLKWAGALHGWSPAEGERPTGYILILGGQGGVPPNIDLGIAAQTIQLGATAMGYGACQLGAFKREDVDAAMEIPPQWNTLLVIALGRPVETVMLEPLPENGETNYWRSKDGVHHVPKRSLNDVMI